MVVGRWDLEWRVPRIGEMAEGGAGEDDDHNSNHDTGG